MRMNKFLCIFLMNTVFIFSFLFASENNATTLEDCINLSLINNPNLKVQKGYEEYQKFVVKHRKGNFLPSVGNSYEVSKRNNDYTYSVLTIRDHSSGVSANMNLYYEIINVTNALNVKSAKKWLQYRKYNTKSYEQQMKLNTTQAFYDAYRIQEVIPLFDAELKEYTELLNFAESNNLSEYDKVFIEIEIKEIEKQIENLKNDYSRSICYLKSVIGNSEIKISTLNSDIKLNPPGADIDNTFKKYLDRRSDVQAAAALKSNSEINVRIAYSNMLPNMSIGGNASYYKSLDDNGYYSNTSYIGANLSVPLFAGFRRKQEIEIAKNDLKMQSNSLEDVRQRAIYEIQNAYQLLVRIEKEYLLNESIIVDARKKFDISIDRYKKGNCNLIDLRDALYKCYESKMNQLNLLTYHESTLAYFKWTIGEI